jgi:hypothetical protein
MGPVRVKLYGLVWMTRRRYVSMLVFAVALMVLLLGVWWSSWPGVRAALEMAPESRMRRVIAFWDMLPWMIGALGLLLAIEAIVVLRLFARREAEQSQLPPTPGPLPTAGEGEKK